MNQPTTAATASPEVEVLAQLLLALEETRDPDGVIADYVERYPDMAGQIREVVASDRLARLAAPAPPPARLQADQRLGPFRIVRFISAGGMGEIYEAEQLDLKRRVALKVIRPDKADEQARARFNREREVLAALHQTHIVPVFASGEEHGLQFIAMQYIDGASLGHVVSALKNPETLATGTTKELSLASLAKEIRDSRPKLTASTASQPSVEQTTVERGDDLGKTAGAVRLTPEYFRSVAEVLANAADALQAAHERGIRHRDLKPSNIMVEPSGKCWLIDFGLATPAHHSASPATEAGDSELTQNWLGTPAYMAPEQFDRSGDERLWDIWGLGATLYELLTRRQPFEGRSRPARQSTQADVLVPPRQVDRSVPRDLDAISRRALSRDPRQRYPSASAFADDLRRWLSNRPTVARPSWITLRPLRLLAWRNKAWATAVSIALIGILVLLVQENRRARIAEREAAELQRGSMFLEATQLRLGPAYPGRRDDALRRIADAKSIRCGLDLRDHAATIFGGLDARLVKEFKDEAGTWLAFDRTGQRLVIGGYSDPRHPEFNQPTRVWNASTDTIEATSTQTETGPVTFALDGTPVQLIPPTEDRRSLLLWDVARNSPLHEFDLPEDVESWTDVMGLAADGNCLVLDVKEKDGKRALLVWEQSSRLPCFRIQAEATALAFSFDGRLLDGHFTSP
jgi:hypothetical protein